ncbi:hypothetical protein FGO68_gene2217 [Halteria grandinella]|uniref:Uncharacterized protein n=1 Tax=Halteria grandinella TaxID=5974 RepID=A0A8J8P1N0_HALGN|nr:hypothetical protein FGO68_gene2217 [Halteria grandinella]
MVNVKPQDMMFEVPVPQSLNRNMGMTEVETSSNFNSIKPVHWLKVQQLVKRKPQGLASVPSSCEFGYFTSSQSWGLQCQDLMKQPSTARWMTTLPAGTIKLIFSSLIKDYWQLHPQCKSSSPNCIAGNNQLFSDDKYLAHSFMNVTPAYLAMIGFCMF